MEKLQERNSRIKNRKFIMTFLVSLFILCVGCGKREISFPPNEEGAITSLGYTKDVEISNTEAKNIVSLTAFKDGFLGTFYGYLYYFDEGEEEILELKCPEGYDSYNDILQGNGNVEKVWYPTGCFYDKKENLLYIANYHGHNILVCTIKDNMVCEVNKVITAESMVSPENVYVSKDGKIAVADYDGNALFLFDKQGELLWSKEIKLAHGVTMSNDYVYVTGLYERKILKFDIDGNLIKEIGEQGYEGRDKFMWPTSLDYFMGKILITDAHTGRIYLYDEDLNYLSSIGGNGASNNTFNFPYCANFINNNIYVADVFNNRIVKINAKGEISSIWGKVINLEEDLVVHPYENIPYTYGEIVDIESSVINPYIDATVVSGYGGLYFVTNDYSFQMNISDYLCNQSIFDKKVPYIDQPYITWVKKVIHKDKTYYIIGSTQTDWYYFIYNKTDNLFYLYMDEDVNFNFDTIWYIEKNWYSVGNIDQMMNYIIEKSEKYTEKFLELRNNGLDRKTAYEISFLDYYNDVFKINMTKDEFDTWLGLHFSSEFGKAFWNNYDPNEAILEKQTNDYFLNTNGGNTHLCEVFLVHTFGEYKEK